VAERLGLWHVLERLDLQIANDVDGVWTPWVLSSLHTVITADDGWQWVNRLGVLLLLLLLLLLSWRWWWWWWCRWERVLGGRPVSERPVCQRGRQLQVSLWNWLQSVSVWQAVSRYLYWHNQCRSSIRCSCNYNYTNYSVSRNETPQTCEISINYDYDLPRVLGLRYCWNSNSFIKMDAADASFTDVDIWELLAATCTLSAVVVVRTLGC